MFSALFERNNGSIQSEPKWLLVNPISWPIYLFFMTLNLSELFNYSFAALDLSRRSVEEMKSVMEIPLDGLTAYISLKKRFFFCLLSNRF